MSFDATARRAPRNWTPWLAGVAALLALAVLTWAAFGSRGGGDRDAPGASAPRRAATPNAVEAVALAPELDPGPAGRLGGPGSAVIAGGPTTTVPAAAVANSNRRSTRTRRPRPRSQPQQEPSRPSYRAIGPSADAPAPSAPPTPGA